MFATFAVIPADPPDLTKLTEYKTSSNISRYFCPRCGASVVNIDSHEWEFATGVLDKIEGRLSRVQLFIGDTKDGGAAAWLFDTIPEAHLGHRDSKCVSESDIMTMRSQDGSENQISAKCRCGDVSLLIAPSNDKYEAGLDACTSCRKVSGFEITAWVTVPQKAITMAGGPLDLESSVLKQYQTSANVHRYFCARCGATIFYLKAGRDSIDVGVGLLRASSGTRAESFLKWEKYDNCVAYQEDGIDQVFVKGLAEGIKKSGH